MDTILTARDNHNTPLNISLDLSKAFDTLDHTIFLDKLLYYGIRGTLPSELRNMTNCSSKSFKQELDTFLKTIPDEPQTPGYTYMKRAESNSLIHMTPLRGCGTKKKLKKSDITMEVGGWVQSYSDFFFKSSQNSSKPVLIFWSSIPYLSLYTCTLIKVVSYYDLSVLSMSVMGFQKKLDGVGG